MLASCLNGSISVAPTTWNGDKYTAGMRRCQRECNQHLAGGVTLLNYQWSVGAFLWHHKGPITTIVCFSLHFQSGLQTKGLKCGDFSGKSIDWERQRLVLTLVNWVLHIMGPLIITLNQNSFNSWIEMLCMRNVVLLSSTWYFELKVP